MGEALSVERRFLVESLLGMTGERYAPALGIHGKNRADATRRATAHNRTRIAPPTRLQLRGADDAGAGMNAEAVAAANDAVGQGSASLRGKRSGAGRATSGDGDRRRAEGYRGGRQRPDVLGIRSPVKCLVAELDVEIARGAEKINARSAERRRGVRFGEIEKARSRGGGIGDREIEPAVRCADG